MRTKRIVVFFVLLHLVFWNTISQAIGKPEPTQSSAKYFAVFEYFDKNQTALKPECLANYTRHSHPLYDRYNLLVLESANVVTATDIENLGQCLGSSWINVPLVYPKTETILIIPTNEIIIRFKIGTQDQDIQTLLKTYDLTVIDASNAFETMTVKTNRPIAESNNIVRGLSSFRELVTYAEINQFVINLRHSVR